MIEAERMEQMAPRVIPSDRVQELWARNPPLCKYVLVISSLSLLLLILDLIKGYVT